MTDLAWHLWRRGYDAISVDRAARGGAADYRSRLLGRRAVVLRSREGARLFYDESVVRRRGAVPPPLAWLLFGRGAVHGLDGVQHRDRKLLFLDALSPERVPAVADDVQRRLTAAAATWSSRRVRLFDELVRAYGGAALRWAGVELGAAEEDDVSRRLAAIVDGFGFGSASAYSRAWRARAWADRWAAELVVDVREGRRVPPPGTPLALVAGAPVDARTAGVELLNVLRPTVAVAWLGTFAAVRLADAPGWRSRLTDPDDERARLAFAQEVRRTTPFVPALAGRVRARAEVHGLRARPGDRVVLDVPGINHDPGRWPEPHRFRPERFLETVPDAFDLVPQGGGHPSGHRCPGENTALQLLCATVRVLAHLDHVPVGRGRADRSRIPCLPPAGGDVLVGLGAEVLTTQVRAQVTADD